MSKESNGQLHLPDLSIVGFRGIRELCIPRLGRVTLLAGKNGVGKTTVLEAVRVYAARGSHRILSMLLSNREEFVATIDEDHDKLLTPHPAALFYNRQISRDSEIIIGPENLTEKNLKIKVTVPTKKQADLLGKLGYDETADDPMLVMRVSFSGREQIIPWLLSDGSRITKLTERRYHLPGLQRNFRWFDDQHELPHALECQSFGPGLLSNEEVADLWDGIALTSNEDRAVQALNLVLGGAVDRVTMVRDIGYRSEGRRVVVKLQEQGTPVSLKSLGDGATRLFGIALALAGSQNGFLVIDEAENGIHHSVHGDFWRMILRTAEENNVQVLATTHSFDCVSGFAKAAVESDASEGVLVRLERETERVRAVVYSEKEIETAAKQRIEVR